MKRKQVLAGLVSLALTVSLLPSSVLADEAVHNLQKPEIQYEVEEQYPQGMELPKGDSYLIEDPVEDSFEDPFADSVEDSIEDLDVSEIDESGSDEIQIEDVEEDQAEDESEVGVEEEEVTQEADLAAADLSLEDEIQLMVYYSGKVKEALLAGQTRVSLESAINANTVKQFNNLYYYCPYASSSVRLSLPYYSSGNYAYISISNSLPQAETEAWINTVDTKLNELYELLDDAGSSVFDQALLLHDYLDSHYQYDRTYSGYYLSDILVNRTGVCQAYAYLFQYVLNVKGIECYTTASDSMGHGWNILQINGNYYHVDNTWDDPLSDKYGAAKHKYFLLSDTAISDHYDWDLEGVLTCSDTGYDGAWYVNAYSPIYRTGDKYYYIDNNGLRCYTSTTGSTITVDQIGVWYVWQSSGSYSGCFSGLSEYGGLLYYNSYNKIKTYDPATGVTAVYASPSVSAGYIYGSVIYGSDLYYSIQTTPSASESQRSIYSIALPERPVPSEDLEIRTQPLSVHAKVGDTISFSIEAENVVSYQWYYSKNGGETWILSTLSSAKTSAITFKVTKSNAMNLYHCVVTGKKGDVETSEAGEILVTPWAVVTQQPSSQTAALNATVTFTVAADNATAYQWYYSKDGSSWYKSTAAGSNKASFTVTATSTNAQRVYRCKITGTDGGSVNSSKAGFILVSQQPKDIEASNTEKISFKVAASNIAAYQWYYSKNQGASWNKSTGTGYNSNTLSLTVTSSNRSNVYRCKLTNTLGISVYTDSASILEKAEGPAILQQPVNVKAAIGDPATFTVKAKNAASYQWYYTKNGTSWYKSSAASATTDSLSITVNTSNLGNQYRCKVIGKDGSSIYTNTVRIIN